MTHRRFILALWCLATIAIAAVILVRLSARQVPQPDPPPAMMPLDDSGKRIFVCTMPDGRLVRTEVYGFLGTDVRTPTVGARECHEVGDDPRGSY